MRATAPTNTLLKPLLDTYSIREKYGEVKGKKSSHRWRHIYTVESPLSNIFALQLQGAEVMVCGPKTLHAEMHINKLGVKVETNLTIKRLSWCDIANMLRVQNERMGN